MKNILSFCLGLIILAASAGRTQEEVGELDLSKIKDGKTWKISNATAEFVEMDGKRVIRMNAKGESATRTVGLALPSGVEFATGIIELDLKGKNERQRSFLGVAFNVTDERTFEAIYFRPFNFEADETSRRRAVQYIAWPKHTWEKLRKAKTGEFEKPVNPAPDPDGWFHARIEVTDKQVRVFVNNAKEPCLAVNRLAESRVKRPIGLFVDVAEGLYANLEVKPASQSGP